MRDHRHGEGVASADSEQGFYNPKTEKLIEPSHTGISYSFTGDGSYEVAYYRSIANRMLHEAR